MPIRRSRRASIHSVPGHPEWRLAPIALAWQEVAGRHLREIKDPGRNGGKDLVKLARVHAKDELVAWGWNPGDGRDPVPHAGAIRRNHPAWIDTGAVCPG